MKMTPTPRARLCACSPEGARFILGRPGNEKRWVNRNRQRRPAAPAALAAACAAAASRQETLEQTLAGVRSKIYPRSVSGLFARWRIAFVFLTQLIFYGLPWLQWNGRQAVLFDLGARKFYLFGLVLWPQDVVYLAVLLVISALALFLFTAVAGRLFCGYACPQTVYTEIFMWIEAQGRRRPRGPHPPGRVALVLAQGAVEDHQAFPVDRAGLVDRLDLHRLFRAHPRTGT